MPPPPQSFSFSCDRDRKAKREETMTMCLFRLMRLPACPLYTYIHAFPFIAPHPSYHGMSDRECRNNETNKLTYFFFSPGSFSTLQRTGRKKKEKLTRTSRPSQGKHHQWGCGGGGRPLFGCICWQRRFPCGHCLRAEESLDRRGRGRSKQ